MLLHSGFRGSYANLQTILGLGTMQQFSDRNSRDAKSWVIEVPRSGEGQREGVALNWTYMWNIIPHISYIYIYVYISIRIQSPSEDSHCHDESAIGPPKHHVTMGLHP